VALVNSTKHILKKPRQRERETAWFSHLYDLWPENGEGLYFQPAAQKMLRCWSPYGAKKCEISNHC